MANFAYTFELEYRLIVDPFTNSNHLFVVAVL